MRVEDKVAVFLADHPGSTVDEIARGVHARTARVREVLASPLFTAETVGVAPYERRVYRVGPAPAEPSGRAGRAVSHNQRVLSALRDGRPHSHHELYALHVVAHSRIAELRRKGHRIEMWRDGDTYWYRLVQPEEAAA